MGVSWLAEILKDKPKVINTSFLGNGLLKVDFGTFGWETKSITVYMPSIDEYVVSQYVIDKAKQLGADYVVCDTWAKATSAAISYGYTIGVKVFKAGVFLHKVEKGEIP
jgi:hypothetical protein